MASARAPEVLYGEGESTVLLMLRGRVHYLMAKSLRALADEIGIRARDATVVIDVSDVEAIDSTGMGLLARIGRKTLERGRRSVLVCPDNDVAICLRSAAFDRLFLVLKERPGAEPMDLRHVALDTESAGPEALGSVMLEAHRDLAELSDKNQRAFADVIALLEAQAGRPARS
jgi:anti-anti-sigma factor